MLRNGSARKMLIAAVWGASTVAGVWLVRGPGAGTIAPGQVLAQEYRIAPVETGRLATVLVAAGQRVAGGQEIARMDTSVLEREIAVAEAHLRYYGTETEASTAALDSDGYETERSFQSDAADARAELENGRSSRALQAGELKQLREELQRQHEYLKEGLTRRDRVDEIALKVRTLESAEAEWPQRIRDLESRHEAAMERLAAWRAKYSTSTAHASRQVRVRPMRQRVAEQIEALRVLRTRLENAKVTAPADGVVVTMLARPGDVVRAGEPFAVLNGEGARQVVAYVQERDGRPLQAGDKAVVRRRRDPREEHVSKVVRVAEAVTLLPARFWVVPQLASWGREVLIESAAAQRMDAGEALDVVFPGGGQ